MKFKIILLILLPLVSVFAEEGRVELKDVKAKGALSKFNKSLASLTKELRLKKAKIYVEHIKQMKLIQREVMKKGKLDEANLIQKMIDEDSATLVELKKSPNSSKRKQKKKKIRHEYLSNISSRPLPVRTKIEDFPLQETSDPLDVFLGKPIYFDTTSSRALSFAINLDKEPKKIQIKYSGTPKLKVIFFNENDVAMGRFVSINKSKSMKKILKNIPANLGTSFVLKLNSKSKSWFLIEEIKFL